MRELTASGFSDLYGRLRQEFADQVGEPSAPYGEANQNIREEIVRCLWFGSHFSPDRLATDDGRRIEVVSPGWWNVEGGPDFVRAELLMEGAGRVVGDVEVHTLASSWHAHGHDRQPEYDEVVLHVVMWNDAPGREIRRHSGEVVPQLTLSSFVEEEIGELVEIIDLEGEETPRAPTQPAHTRYCGQALADGKMEAAWLGRLLDCAGDHRLLSKADRMTALLEKQPREQVLYESLAEALGYKSNRMAFLQLANLLPMKVLREIAPADAPPPDRQEVLEAAFYGVAGFLDGALPEGADAETADYARRLAAQWKKLPARLRDVRMSPGHWTFAGTRPVNYPTRRIAALACLYGRYLPQGLFGPLVQIVRGTQAQRRRRLDTALRAALTGVFTQLEHPYWSHRYTLGGRKLRQPHGLVGEQRAGSILTDVLVPLLIAHAGSEADGELERRLHLLWSGLPGRPANAVVRRMCHVLFPGGKDSGGLLRSARRQQGLHQLHNDFCAGQEGCGSCVLYLAHRAGRKLEEI